MTKMVNNVDLEKISQTIESGKEDKFALKACQTARQIGSLTQAKDTSLEQRKLPMRKENRLLR